MRPITISILTLTTLLTLTTGTWSPGPSLNTGRAYAGVVSIPSTQTLCVLGGLSGETDDQGGHVLSSIECSSSPSSPFHTLQTPLPTPLFAAGWGAYPHPSGRNTTGCVVGVGGLDVPLGDFPPSPRSDVFSLCIDALSPTQYAVTHHALPPLPRGVYGTQVHVADGTVFVLGGLIGPNRCSTQWLSLPLQGKEWKPLDSPRYSHCFGGLAMTRDGSAAYAFSGIADNAPALNTFEQWNAVADGWIVSFPLAYARDAPASVMIPRRKGEKEGGREGGEGGEEFGVLVMGGRDPEMTFLTTVEVLHPLSGWSLVPEFTLPTPVMAASAALLPSSGTPSSHTLWLVGGLTTNTTTALDQTWFTTV